MEISVTGHVPTTGDCGHKFEVPIAGIEDEFECPVCGAKDRFSDEQIEAIKQQVRAAAGKFGADLYAKEISKGIARAVRGSKHIKHRPKR
jgi:phage/plasmid primase-like uncharacterized protein